MGLKEFFRVDGVDPETAARVHQQLSARSGGREMTRRQMNDLRREAAWTAREFIRRNGLEAYRQTIESGRFPDIMP